MLEALNKNTNLVELNFNGNRFSHSFLGKLKKILTRNIRMIEEQEPNKLKAEIYRLRYEHGKLEAAKTALKIQKQEIENVKKLKSDLQVHMKEYKADQE
jgi:NLR family CARD domain-containing protein 3